MTDDKKNDSRFHSRFSITTERPVAILMVVMAVCVFGWVSYQRLALTLMPDISYPALTVRTEYPGTAPEEIENLVSRRLEQELGIIPNLVTISSISKAGQSDVILEFGWDTDMTAISQEIREKVDRVRLPDEARRPLLLHYDPTLDPIMRIGFFGPQSLYDLRYQAEYEIKRALESVGGIAAVKVKGGLEEQYHVALDERKLALMGLDISQVNNRLAQNNINIPGGNLREAHTEYLIRTLNEFQSMDEIADLIITRQAGIDVRLKDIGQVTRAYKDREIITRVNGRESIEIEIYKEADANVVAVAESVRNRIFGLPAQRAWVALQAEKEASTDEPDKADAASKEGDLAERKKQAAIESITRRRMTDFIEYRLPEGAGLEVLSDQSIFIKNSIREVKSNAILGGLMAVFVLFVFLRNVVHTLIVGLTIPISIVATFAPMYLFGVSLNIISLGGLALGVGILVDNSIVVLESIFRCREEGDDMMSSTVRGVSEVGSAVMASTLTTVAVFFPIVFVEGVAGQVFGDMALTVVFSLLASLAVALFFIPMLASRRLGTTGTPGSGKIPSSGFLRFGAENADAGRTARFSETLLVLPQWILRLFILGVAIAVLVVRLIGLLIFPLMAAMCALIEKVFLRRSPRLPGVLTGFPVVNPRLAWADMDHVWPGLIRFEAPSRFLDHCRRLGAWRARARTFPGRTLRGIPLLLAIPIVLLIFYFGIFLRGIGCLVHILLVGTFLSAGAVITFFSRIGGPLLVPVLNLFERGFGIVQNGYPHLLRWSLRNPAIVLGTAVVAFLATVMGVVPKLGRELIPQVHQGEFNLDITLPVGTPLERTAEVARVVEDEVLRHDEVDRIATSVGSENTATSSSEEGEHTGKVTVSMKDGLGARDEDALIDRIRGNLADLPETKIEVSYPALFSFKSPVEVEIKGFDLMTLREVSRQAESNLSAVPGLVDIKSSLQAGNPELQISYNRDRLAEYELDLRAVAERVRDKVQGQVATEFRRQERQIDIFVRLNEADRLGVDEIERLVINPGNTVPIRLSAVADIRINEGPSEIRRINQERAALLTANVRGADLASVSAGIASILSSMEFPEGFSYKIAGQNAEMQTSTDSLILALSLALFLVYIVMASQFESLIHPFIIMFTVPLAVIGSTLALWLFGMSLSITVFIGLIMLAGIVVNNAIVLVDYINHLRKAGLDKLDAIMQAGSIRLRPIIMTTTTTVLGLIPMALGLGDGAEIRTPMAITVIFGLISSTVLTLVVIPTVYMLIDRRKIE
ncbi:MAG: AcrB/AcrD/AcrF family protein [Verrucomicrobia bacterium]|nr:MAG: AcrB/AcrD/AcrF family protein [Verrucomicrobiota bacterium]